jgi:DNA-binding MarR family transcriptional regulator
MGWTFLTTHGLVLVEIAGDPQQTMRALAEKLGVSERTVQSVIRDLVAEGYVTRMRIGRRNVYRVDPTRPMRHPVAARHDVAALLRALG